ncbi:MAG: alpha/beta fold hydrolase [Desulfomonilia bacterium]
MNDYIMMIHGAWCGNWVWENFIQYFEGLGYRCIAPNLRFHERQSRESPPSRLGKTSLLDYAEDLENEILKLDEKPVLMGHSMGGLLAQMLGSRGLAKAIVLLTPAPPRGIFILNPSFIKSIWSALTTWGYWYKPLLLTFNEAVYAFFEQFSADERKELYECLVPESGRAGTELFQWVFDMKHASAVDEARITCPTLVIGAFHDKIMPPAVVRKIAHKYRAVTTFKEYLNHTHWVLGEPGWTEVAESCSGWLDQVLLKAPRRPQHGNFLQNRSIFKMKKAVSGFRKRAGRAAHGDRRRHQRKEFTISVEATVPFSGNAQHYDIGHTINISRGGVYLNTDMPLHEGAYINMNLNISRSERPVWAQGQVVRSTDDTMALEFSHGEAERLNRFLTV